MKFEDPELSQLQPYFKKAKSISTSVEEEVYFLRIILSNAVKGQKIDSKMERKVHELIKHSNYIDFYEHKKKPDFDNWPIIFTLVMITIGLMVAIAGLNTLFTNGYLLVNNGRMFGSFVSGGAMLLSGLVFLIGGGIKTIHQYRRNQFLSQLSK